jgi:hypothetical protein
MKSPPEIDRSDMMEFMEQHDAEEVRPPYIAPMLTTLGSFEQLTKNKPGTKTDGLGGSTKAGGS